MKVKQAVRVVLRDYMASAGSKDDDVRLSTLNEQLGRIVRVANKGEGNGEN